jgi:hypothetical protein
MKKRASPVTLMLPKKSCLPESAGIKLMPLVGTGSLADCASKAPEAPINKPESKVFIETVFLCILIIYMIVDNKIINYYLDNLCKYHLA